MGGGVTAVEKPTKMQVIAGPWKGTYADLAFLHGGVWPETETHPVHPGLSRAQWDSLTEEKKQRWIELVRQDRISRGLRSDAKKET
jgi:hypothetical protein